jgi:type IV secretory pathway protease TraF
MLQTAVAFWIVLLGLTMGCNRSKNSITKYQLSSSSMGPTWFGPHLTATCGECGQQSEVIQEAFDPSMPTRCFSCGAVCDCSSKVQPGEVIEIVGPASRASLQRFDVITFSSSESNLDASADTLKRIWALPGEQLELNAGEAWINGKLLRKNAREFASICIPLSRFPKDTRSHWWVTDQATGEQTRIEAAAERKQLSLESGQQLEFRYARPNPAPKAPKMVASPVVDDFPFNQNSIARFHEVTDFLLAIEIVKPTRAPWSVCLSAGGKLFRVHIASRDGHGVSIEPGNATRLIIAVCDGRLLVSTESMDLQSDLAELTSEPIAGHGLNESMISISTTGTLAIRRLLVARDQWLAPSASRETEGMPSGSGNEIGGANAGYFVLGDNLERSIDSRDASIGRISPDRITGQVKPVAGSSAWIQSLLSHAFREVSGSQQ